MLAIANEKKDADSLHKMALQLSRTGDKDSALFYLEQEKAIREKVGPTHRLIKIYADEAEVYRSIVDLEKAMSAIKKGEALIPKAKPTPYNADLYNRKAAILFELKQVDSCLVAVKKSQDISRSFNDSLNFFNNLTIEGACYRELGKYHKADLSLRTMLAKAQNRGDIDHCCLAAYNLANSYLTQNKPDSALIYVNHFLNADYSNQSDVVINDVYRYRVNAYEQLGEYKLALQFMDSAYELRLKTNDILINERIDETRIKHQLAVNSLEKEMLVKEKESAKLQLIIAILIGLLLSLGIVSFWYRRKKLLAINAELKTAVEFKNKLIAIVAHDIKNPMNGVVSLFRLYNDKMLEKEQLDAFFSKLESAAIDVNLLLDNLLNWVKSQDSNFNVHTVQIHTKELVQDIETTLASNLSNKHITLVTNFENMPEKFNSDLGMISLVLRNLISNSIKFSEENSQIELDIKRVNGSVDFVVKDYGIGMNETMVSNLFNGTRSAKGTNKEAGTGIGLKLVHEMVQKLNGTIHVKSKLGIGTEIRVSLPA
ncbi:MAG: hypothetical protein KDC92_12550 [Bacteroidetes bacterium]|nr:hypothetical protein [Bacteroidota bacterium]